MKRCNNCGEGGLSWKRVAGKWCLSAGTTLHKCQPPTPKMRKAKEMIDKDLDSRRMLVIGFRFNNSNLKDGLLDSILDGEYNYE